MKSLPFTLVAVDPDGTLADEHNRCSAADLRALHAVAERGAYVVIASGRMHAATERFWREAGLNAPILSYNGAMVKHPRDGLVWFHLTVPAPLADEIVDFCETGGYHLNYYLNDHLYVKEETPWSRLYHQRTGSVIEPVGSLTRFRGQSPTSFILIDTPETTDRLKEDFRARFGERLHILKSNDEYLEFMHPGADKARTLRRLAYQMGVPRERVLAIGDGNNDIPMMRWAGYAVAMGNAKPAVKELAHWVAPPIEQNGLAVALVEIFGLNREEVSGLGSVRLIMRWAGVFWVALVLSGCGTFFRSETVEPPASTGSLSLTIVWTGDRSDPAAPQAVRLTLYRGDQLLQENILRRADTASTIWTTPLESGTYRLRLQVYPSPEALGTPITSGEVGVQVTPDAPQRLQIATSGTPVALVVLPNPLLLHPGQVQPLSVLGVDAQGRYLLLPTGATVRWSVSDSSVVNLGADGVARALAPGNVTVSASVDSLSLSGTGAISVQTVTREWTILVFMNAANNLEPDSVDDMNEMEQLGSTADVNIVVQWKRIAGYDSSNGDWRTTRRYYVTKDTDPNTVGSNLLVDLGTGVDMGSPNTLRDFLQWGVRSFPARRYMVVLWNHGSGWRAYRDRWNILTRGVSFDDNTGNYIRIWELPTALSVGVKWDIIAFDASLMQMLEVAYEIRNLGDYIVGSEESPPAPGYPYHRILAPVVANPSIATRDFAAQIVAQTLAYYNPDNTDNITQSALDASQIENVARKVDALAITLLRVASGQGAAVRAARENAQAYAEYTYKDLWDYTEQLRARLTSNPELTDAINGVQNALSQAIVAEGHSNRRVNRSRGLSIYIPTPSGYETRYGLLAFARATHWDEWLQSQPQ